jgi:hypothetical protein
MTYDPDGPPSQDPDIMAARAVVDRQCSMGCTIAEWNASLDILIARSYRCGWRAAKADSGEVKVSGP